MCGIDFHLFAQTIDVSFHRVRHHTSIVPPHLAENHVATCNTIARPIKVPDKVGFFRRKPYFLASSGIDQELRTWAEGVRTDREYRVIALLALTQLRSQSRKQDVETERLGDVILGTRFEP